MFFFFNDTATTEIYTLSLHDALPISNLRTETASTLSLDAAPSYPRCSGNHRRLLGIWPEHVNRESQLMLAVPSEEQQSLYQLAFVNNCFVLVVRAFGVRDADALNTAEE